MKKLKCIKCGIYFKDRKDGENNPDLCWNCKIIWNYIGLCLLAIGDFKKVNRIVEIHLDDVRIKKYARKP